MAGSLGLCVTVSTGIRTNTWAAALALSACVLVAPARAATVTMIIIPAPPDSRFDASGRFTFTAAAGERNTVTLRADGPDLLVSDATAALQAGSGCQPEAMVVRCPLAVRFGRFADLGDGDDTMTVDARFGGGGAIVEGGGTSGGDDELAGGPDADSLDGGSGNDAIEGGSGADHLIGGAGADRLDPSLAGRETRGEDQTPARPAPPARDRVDCGDGADTVEGPDRADSVAGDCELLTGADDGPRLLFTLPLHPARSATGLTYELRIFVPAPHHAPLRVRLELLDRHGRVVGRSPRVTLPAGQNTRPIRVRLKRGVVVRRPAVGWRIRVRARDDRTAGVLTLPTRP
jgi:hypothetical protein